MPQRCQQLTVICLPPQSRWKMLSFANCSLLLVLEMDYYTLTTGLDSSDSEEEDCEQTPSSGHRLGSGSGPGPGPGPTLDQAVGDCLASSTMADIRREYSRNRRDSRETKSSPGPGPGPVTTPAPVTGVVMRRKPASSAGAGYGRRASQRFSRLLEGCLLYTSPSPRDS